MELRDYWVTVRRRWKVVVLVLLACLGIAALYTWQATPQYSSSARLFVSTSPSDTTDAYQGNLYASQRVNSYRDLVTGRQLADRVSEELGSGDSAPDPERLRSQVTATVVPETVILEISATSSNAEYARDVAQTYAEELTDLVEEIESPARGRRNALIQATIVDDAQVSTDPVSPQPVRNMALAGVLGLLLGLGLAVVRELLDTTIKSEDDVSEITGVPILGRVLDDRSAHEDAAQALTLATPWSEAFRVLRTNMQYVDIDHDQKVVVMTSPLPAEGKSTTATGLAITMAQAGQRVALVEADLRRPMMAQRLGIDDTVGTTTVLIGKVSLDEALAPYQDTGLQVLTSGPVPPNPSELLQSTAMEKLLSELRDRFDVVILDAPPLLPVTDAAVLSAQADGAVIVLRFGKTGKDELAQAIQRLETVDARNLGVVVNRAPGRRAGSGYGYGYGYGYGHDVTPSDTRRSKREAKTAQKALKKSEASRDKARKAGKRVAN